MARNRDWSPEPGFGHPGRSASHFFNQALRVLLIPILLVAIAGTTLWLLGGKRNQADHEVLINAPPAAVFPYLTEPELLTLWVQGLTEVHRLDLPLDTGSRSRRRIEINGRSVELREQIINYEQNEFLSIQLHGDNLFGSQVFWIEPSAGSTRLISEVQSQYEGLARFTALLRTSPLADTLEEDLERLKRLVESREAQPPAAGADPPAGGDDANPRAANPRASAS